MFFFLLLEVGIELRINVLVWILQVLIELRQRQEMSFDTGRKWCFVPKCQSTSTKMSSKMFLAVPRQISVRRQWAKMARRDDANTITSTAPWFCCEDHFNVSMFVPLQCQFELAELFKVIIKGLRLMYVPALFCFHYG